MKIRIYYEDTDIGGIVYYANYLKFCERARSEIFFKQNKSPHEEKSFFVVKNIEANYISSAHFADIIDVKTEVIKMKNASILLKQDIFKDEKLIFSSKVTLAYLSNSKLSKIPGHFIDIFNNITD